MKNKLVLITESYPFGAGDCSFVEAEANELMYGYQLTVVTSNTTDLQTCSITGDAKIVRKTRCVDVIQFAKSICKISLWKELKKSKENTSVKIWLKRAKDIVKYNYVAEYYQHFFETEMPKQQYFYTYWNTARTLALVRMKKKNPEIRIITRMHGMDLFNERTSGNWQPFRDETSQALDGVFFVSRNGKEYYEQHWKLHTNAVSEIAYLGCYGGENYKKSWENKLVIASCSNCIPLKRVALLIDSLALLKDVPWEWHHFGDGTEMKDLQKKAEICFAKLQNATWNFHGFVTNQELMNQYKILGVNLFMTVSQTEGLPVSVLEAFSCGIPVIATAVGGIPEAVQEEKTGHLLASNPTTIEVANIVSRFWNSSTEVKEKLSGNAYEFWKSDFQAKKNAENFCRTIQRIFK